MKVINLDDHRQKIQDAPYSDTACDILFYTVHFKVGYVPNAFRRFMWTFLLGARFYKVTNSKE